MRPLVIIRLVLLLTTLNANVWAQASNQAAANRAWDLIKSHGRFDSPPLGSALTDPPNPARTTADILVEQADQLKGFRLQFPTHSEVGEARRLEALCLGWAAVYGNHAHEARRVSLVQQVLADRTITAKQAYEVTASHLQVGISRQRLAARSAYLPLQEAAARSLIAEFPTVAESYEPLLQIARDSDPVRGAVIAQDLQRLNAPAGIKKEAGQLLDQLALVGQSLATLLAQAGVSPPPELGSQKKLSIVYVWSSLDRESLRSAKQIELATPEDSKVGINIDADSNSARQLAVREKLAGEHYYDNKGANGQLARALKIDRAGQVYLVDRAGIIRDVFGAVHTSEKLERLRQ